MTKSGFAVNQEVVDAFMRIKKKKSGACRFLINSAESCIELEPGSEIVFDDPGAWEKSPNYTTTVAGFPDGKCRFGLVDGVTVASGNEQSQKMVLLMWAPESAKVGDRMKASSSFDALKAKLQITNTLQMNDDEDKGIHTILHKLTSISKNDVVLFEGRPVTKCPKSHDYKFSD